MLRALSFFALALSIGCRPEVSEHTEGQNSMKDRESVLSNLDQSTFDGLAELTERIESQGAKYSLANSQTLEELELKTIDVICAEREIFGEITLYIDDGNLGMSKNYIIRDVCSDTIKPIKDFAYKNPYQ